MYRENDDIIVNLTITQHCYARCKGCINSSLTFPGAGNAEDRALECDPVHDARLVSRIASKYPEKDITLCFYGGEPFMYPGRMDEVRRLLSGDGAAGWTRYMAYSNGELIAAAIPGYPELVKSIWLYSISIDGSAAQHERVRPGTSLSKVISSLRQLREVYQGQILVWSTLREEQSLMDCFQQFISMHNQGLADHFFWHWADTPQPFQDFTAYCRSYSADLDKVMEQYLSWLHTGKVMPVSHLNELILYLLEGRQRGHTACAVELAHNFDVRGGRVHACADLPDSFGAFSSVGNIDIPREMLQSLVKYKEGLGCRDCDVHFYCGGRCPVQALAGSPERTLQICSLMHIQVDAVKRHIPDIRILMQKHGISPQQVYDSSAFIARYTDVVP